jgi:hypothetical protein
MMRPNRILARRALWVVAALVVLASLLWLARRLAPAPAAPSLPTLAVANPDPRGHGMFGRALAWGDRGFCAGDPASARAWLLDSHTGRPLLELRSPEPASDGSFGEAVAVAGDLVAVGAPRETREAPQVGAVYVFDGTTGALRRRIANPTPQAGEMFGAHLVADGSRLLVAAPRHRDAAHEGGAVYLFEAASGRLLMTFGGPALGRCSEFGSGLALQDQAVLVGAPHCAEAGVDGAVSVYDATSGRRRLTITNPRSGQPSLFGGAVAFLGGDVLVGARQHEGRRGGTGAVYLFEGQHGRLRAAIESPAPELAGAFGAALATLDARRFVAAAPQAERVYVFEGQPPHLAATLASPSLSTTRSVGQTHFGASLASLGTLLLVAAPDDDPGFARGWADRNLRPIRPPRYDPRATGGAVYVYDLR